MPSYRGRRGKALDLIAELEEKAASLRKHQVLAPIPEGRQFRVTTLIEGIPYHLEIPKVEPGWWLLQPLSDHEAQVVEPPLPYEIIRYLEQLPAMRVIAVYRLGWKSWLVYPWNEGDAHQRGWPSAISGQYAPQPRPLHLVTAPAIRPFDVLVVRMLDDLLLYDEHDRRTLWAHLAGELLRRLERREWQPRLRGLTAELEAVLSLHHHRILLEEKRRIEREEAERRRTLEGRLQSALEYSGAILRAWTERGQGYEVVWEHEGREYRTVIRPDLFVRSAGVCLSGRESDYNLSAIVHVMQLARGRGGP